MVKSGRPPSSPTKLGKFVTMKTAMKRSPTQMMTLQQAAMACGPWEYCASVHARWPGLEGGASLISEIHKTYVLEENATLPWYKPNGKRPGAAFTCTSRYSPKTWQKYRMRPAVILNLFINTRRKKNNGAASVLETFQYTAVFAFLP